MRAKLIAARPSAPSHGRLAVVCSRRASAFAHACSRMRRVAYRGFQMTGRGLIRMDATVTCVNGVSPGQFLIAFAIAAVAGTAVFFHAERHRIKHPSAWASFVFLFLIVGLPAYALHVRQVRRRRSGR